jgi:subtilisin family serine protease
MKIKFAFSLIVLFPSLLIFSQDKPQNWHHLDYKKDGFPGISLDKAYKLIEENKLESTPVIVAVLDSGLDINHEDLNAVLWQNPDEVEANNKDDDGNGYVDDVNGWNFIGGDNGKSVEAETLEITRLYRTYQKKFESKNRFNITSEEKAEYKQFLIYKKAYEDGKNELTGTIGRNQEEYDFFNNLIPPLQEAIGEEVFTERDLKKAKLRTSELDNLRDNYFRILERNKENGLTSEKLINHFEELSSRMEQLKTRLEYNYSLKFDGRSIIGDDYENLSERFYGNNDLTKRSEHGTHVSGIIGAVRDNEIGVNGIADHVIIMPIRNTPMGDERDKDVANGIRYAVDNGARIINMSFGKSYSPDKQIVDEAIKYAQEKGVLLIHGAGNDGKNTDYYFSFPTALLEDGNVVDNWLEVGASSFTVDENLTATFSNYGTASVDIFAPGVDINSTLPDNDYGTRSGTSMASPVVSGVSALLLSYFPELTPQEVIDILKASATDYDIEVKQPGSENLVSFSSLSKTGKIVNAYEAIKLAIERRNK